MICENGREDLEDLITLPYPNRTSQKLPSVERELRRHEEWRHRQLARPLIKHNMSHKELQRQIREEQVARE